MPTLLRFAGAVAAILAMAGAAMGLEVRAAVLRVDPDLPLPISRLDIPPDDLGFAGAVLATEDNQTTGNFLGMEFTTVTRAVPPEDAASAVEELRRDGIGIIVVLAEGVEVTALADLAGEGAFVLNAGARDEAVREEACRANLLHVAPSRAMLADAVIQFLIWKQWRRLVLIHGSHPKDHALADAYRQAARKFGAEIVGEREYIDRGGARRTDTGHVLVQREMPVFMQDLPEHDVVIAADEADVFAAYLPYHQWLPHPVAGSAGLIPVTWHAAHEAWGATQFQRRFEKLTGRTMREEDYQVWLALRVVGEAVSRTNSADPVALRDYAMSDAFELAAFKGQKLTFRPWNGQLRQPVLLTDRHITVAVSPQEGFLHQVSPLDTLGPDQPETRCTAFGG
ncbi:MAG: ABC transporter substrate-binding protein [Albidovulum sp.]|uniref:ABC transporter substrate-binding protein n=1 Tax=Albidovulum sp. TaxID=1872424 RepID=UPI003CBD787C